MSVQWGRLLTAMITPYERGGNVDYAQAAALAQRLLANGSDGLVLWGTTAESPVLSADEKERIYTAVRERVGAKELLLVATGTNDTRKTIANTVRAAELGADGVMVVAPYYNKPSQKGLYEHYRAVATSTSLPILIYNIPSRTGVSIDAETVAKLAEFPNVAAIKESSGNVLQASYLRRVLPKEFLVYSGDDPLTLPMLSLGAHGVISVASHVASKSLRRMIDAFVAGDVVQALELHEKLLPLFEALFCDVNPVPVKIMLDAMGFSTGGCRLPLVDPDESIKAHIRQTLQTMPDKLVDEYFNMEVCR